MREFGLIGASLAHSFSQKFFTDYFAKNALDARYKSLEIKSIDEFPTLLEKQSFSGLNVTIPYKESILPYLDELTEEAAKIGAVNTIIFKDGKKIGANTDAFGFHQMIKPFLLNTHHQALIIGNGGASKAISYVLKNIGLDIITAARNPKKGEYNLNEVYELMVKFCPLIVNCTPLGTFPNFEECPPIPLNFFTPQHLVIDLIYNPAETKLLQAAKSLGAVTLNGETMLKQQALKSWELWGF